MRQVLFFCLLSFTFALGKGEWSEPSEVSKVVDPILPVRRTGEVVPETLRRVGERPTTVDALAIGGATPYMPNYVMTNVQQPRGNYAQGASEMSIGINRYDESKGKMSVFSWTYHKYTKGLQPASQDIEITPLSRTERPDQAAITFPPPVCRSADESSTESFSSSQSVSTSKKKTGGFNIGIKVPLGKGATAGASYQRGWSDSINTYRMFSESGSTTMTKTESIAESGLHWRIKDTSSLSIDFTRAVAELDNYSLMSNWTTVCEGEGEILAICAYKGFNGLLREFVNTFGTDYMNDATFGGKMTLYKGVTTKTSTSASKKTVAKDASESWSASVEVMGETDRLKQKASQADSKASIASHDSDMKAFKADAKMKADAKKAAAAEIAKDAAKADQLQTAAAKAEAEAKAAAKADELAAARRLLFTGEPAGDRRLGISGGASSSSSSSETREENDESTAARSNSVLKFYGCSPSRDPITWCSSCKASPVAIEYSIIPLSTLFQDQYPDLAKRLESYIEDEYQIECLPGWTWNKANGECDKNEKCPKGTAVVLGEPQTRVVSADVPADGTCICDCVGTTHPDLVRTFVLSVDGTTVTNESDTVNSTRCRSDYADYPQCNDGRVYNCRTKSIIDTVTNPAVDQFYSSVSIKSEGCNETVQGVERRTLYNCQSQSCSIERRCEAKTAMEGKGVKESCGCPIEFEYQHCRADDTWFSCGNPSCRQNYNYTADTDDTRCNFTKIEKQNNCWCGDESSKWKQCDSDKSWFYDGSDKFAAFRDVMESNASNASLVATASNAMVKECTGKRMCASDNSLFEHACPTKGLPCASLSGNAALSLQSQNQNQMCFSAGTGGLTAFACANCEPGKFSSAVNSQRCEDCPVGKFTEMAGAAECQACPEGSSGDKCQSKSVPYNAQAIMKTASGREATSMPCQFKNYQSFRGCWNLDEGPIGRELKNGNKCDIQEVALPAGVGVKLYTFGPGSWPDGVGKGEDSCCTTDSTADIPGTCIRTSGNQVEYVGKFLPKADAPSEIPNDQWQNKDDTGFVPGFADTGSRRLLGSGRTGVCMYDLYLLDGYECAERG